MTQGLAPREVLIFNSIIKKKTTFVVFYFQINFAYTVELKNWFKSLILGSICIFITIVSIYSFENVTVALYVCDTQCGKYICETHMVWKMARYSPRSIVFAIIIYHFDFFIIIKLLTKFIRIFYSQNFTIFVKHVT